MGALHTWGLGLRLVWGVLTVTLLVAKAQTTELHTTITAGVGRHLNTEAPQTSLTLEPQLNLAMPGNRHFVATTIVDRPVDPYKNFSVPKTVASLVQDFDLGGISTSALFSSTLQELDRWSKDGRMVRLSGGLQMTVEPRQNFAVLVRVGPFVGLHSFRQKINGTDLARYGFNERIKLAYQKGRVEFQLHLGVEQKYTAVWKNEYFTFESVAYRLSDSLKLGISHELLSSSVDSTGFYRTLRLTDGRESRVATFVEMNM